MDRKMDNPQVAEILKGDALAAAKAAWTKLCDAQGIAADQANFGAVAKHDILSWLESGAAVVAGFFYRDNNAEGQYTPGEALAATLLGSPTLTGPDAPEIKTYGNCFAFGPLKAGETYTLTYDIHGIEPFSQEIVASTGLNVCHVPVAPTKTLAYVVCHSHFDPEWRSTYPEYLDHELPQLMDRIRLLRVQPEHNFSMDEELAVRPLLDRHPEILDELRQRV